MTTDIEMYGTFLAHSITGLLANSCDHVPFHDEKREEEYAAMQAHAFHHGQSFDG